MSRIVESLYLKAVENVDFNDLLSESILCESSHIDTDGLPDGVEIKDGYKFKSSTLRLEDCKPTIIDTSHFNTENDALEFCSRNGLSSSDVKYNDFEGYFEVSYTKQFKVERIGYSINCTLNQYNNGKVDNTFNNFPMEVKNIIIPELTSKEIIKYLSKKYKIPSNAGVSKNSIHINYYIFEIKFVNYK